MWKSSWAAQWTPTTSFETFQPIQAFQKWNSRTSASCIGHPETCECVNCIDTTLHNILIKYSLSVAKHLLYVSRPEQSGEALELVQSVCQCAEKKMVMCVQRLEMILCGCACSAPSEGILKETKKKGKAKSAKGRKQKEDSGLQSCSVSQLMFCQYFASFYCI